MVRATPAGAPDRDAAVPDSSLGASFRPGRGPGVGGPPDYHAPVGLSLVVGPVHAGKVRLLLDRFVDALDRDPWLVVPNRADVERLERELVERCGGLLAGTVGTFDSLFEHLAQADAAAQARARRRRADARPAPGRGGPIPGRRPLLGVRRRARPDDRRPRRRARRPRRARRSRSRACCAPTATSSSGWAPGTAARCAVARSSGSPASSTRGAARPSSRTASRT